MPRSATDATRFTSTTPHATSIPQSAARLQQAQQKQKAPSGPPGETPLEKVRRLRAAADRARNAQVSTMDKLIVRGRVWADFAHRTTTLFLIGCTFVAGGVTVYALGDMIVYNRKKRAEFFAEQKAIHQNAIHKAQQSIASGTATEAELEFLQREKDHDQYLAETARQKAAKKGVFQRGKEWLFSGLSNGEEEVAKATDSAESFVREEMQRGQGKTGEVLRTLENKKTELSDKAKQAFADEKERQRLGGPLDRLASSSATDSEQPKSGGWTSFMIRK